MRGVQLDRFQRPVVHAAGTHEPHGPVDLTGQVLVADAGLGVAGELGVPGVDAVQRGQPAPGVGAQQVQRAGGGVVGAQDALGVGPAQGRVLGQGLDEGGAGRGAAEAAAVVVTTPAMSVPAATTPARTGASFTA